MGWETYDDEVREDYEKYPKYCKTCGTRLKYNPYGSDCPNASCPAKPDSSSGGCPRCGGSLVEVDTVYGYAGGSDHDGKGPRICRVIYQCVNCDYEIVEEYEE